MKKRKKSRGLVPRVDVVKQDSSVINLGSREYLIPFDRDEYKGSSLYVIGNTKCPDCNQKVHLANDQGSKGNAIFDYATEHHYPAPSTRICIGSRKRPVTFFSKK